MNSSEVPSRIPLIAPFASSGDVSTIADSAGNTINFPQGFPSIYSTPASSGGKYVKRDDINAIGLVATNDLFYHKCGGINTFDAAFSAKIGGYPKGAVLQYRNGTYLYDVVSLVENNTFDFVATNTIDNVNWAYCNKVEVDSDSVEVFSYEGKFYHHGTAYNYGNLGCIVGLFCAPKSGPLFCVSDATGGELNTQYALEQPPQGFCGAGILVLDLGTSKEGYSSLTPPSVSGYKSAGWKIEYDMHFGSVTWVKTNEQKGDGVYEYHPNAVLSPREMISCEYGHYYVVAYAIGAMNGSGSTIKLTIN